MSLTQRLDKRERFSKVSLNRSNGEYMPGFIVFSGNSNHHLAKKICEYLDISLGEGMVKRFSDGEIQIEIIENVRAKDVFVIQSTCSPVNDNLINFSS